METDLKPPDQDDVQFGAEAPRERKISRFLVRNLHKPEGTENLEEEEMPPSENLEENRTNFTSPPVTEVSEDATLQNEHQQHCPIADKKAVHFELRAVSPAHSSYNTHVKTWNHQKTLEHPPIMDFYRDSIVRGVSRPTMAQLIHGNANSGTAMVSKNEMKGHARNGAIESPTRVKFGWVQGVFVRCLLNIFGVMLYLRISWVAGQAGIGLGSAVVILASLVTTITAISTCAICTNGEVKGGGAYFLISRTLGPEFGGAIGLIFSVANAVGGAMYIVGFAETVRDLMRESSLSIIDGDLWDVRIIGAVTCILLVCIVFIGTEFESKMQVGLLFILLGSLVNYAVGSVFPPTDEMKLRGATGYRWNTMMENFLPSFRDEDFFSVFAVYFPAATGIMAGANISGDLADPQSAIPFGTLLAILVTTVTYLVAVWTTGSSCVREADGINFPQWNGSVFIPPSCSQDASCPYGLMNYFQVMEMESLWGPLITAGIFAATLSSALASLVSAPKVFQAVCKDKLYPKIGYFAKGYGKNEEPRRAYFLAFVICIAIIGIGELNAIAPIISNFFLASYALINYACFDQSFANSPGFRPGFKYYNMWMSLAGALLCVLVMFIVSWVTALVTFACFGFLFLYIHHRKPEVNWGSSGQAHSYKNALNGMFKLSQTEDHVKTFRPQFLVLTGKPTSRPSLVDFARSITKDNCLMVCGNVVTDHPSHHMYALMRKLDRKLNLWLQKRKIRGFYAAIACPSFRTGTQNLIQSAGLGRLRPNTLLIGFRSKWNQEIGGRKEMVEDLNEYFGIVEDAFAMNLGVCVLRNGEEGLDLTQEMKQVRIDETTGDEGGIEDEVPEKFDDQKEAEIDEEAGDFELDCEMDCETLRDQEENEGEEEDGDRDDSSCPDSPEESLLAQYSFQTKKVKRGVIDVWWLYEDGGLTLLLPHLLSQQRSYLAGSKLRIFTIPTSSRTAMTEQINMGNLLNKFRIPVSQVIQVKDIAKEPGDEIVSRWNALIEPWISEYEESVPGLTSRGELATQQRKTNRHLRIRELLEEHSADADLIVMSLPVPRKNFVSAALYMAWLDVMSSEMPPTLFVRGNQTPVLTVYS